MKRMMSAIILSIAVHALLLSVLKIPEERAPQELMRVSLSDMPAAAPPLPQMYEPLYDNQRDIKKVQTPPALSEKISEKTETVQVKSEDLELPQPKTEPVVVKLPEEKKAEKPKKPDKLPEKPVKKEEKPQIKPAETKTQPPVIESPSDAQRGGATQVSAGGGPNGQANGAAGGTAAGDSRGVSGASGTPGQTGRNTIVDVAALTVTKKIPAEYPMISRKRRDQGTVTLLATIKSGRVASVEVERSSGFSPLDEAAVRSVRGWEFNISGHGDSVVARIPFVFTLK
jgi:protein TonB